MSSLDIIGSKTGLLNVIEKVKLVASASVPVLLTGETGTGKEVISRLIHSLSKRAEKPFVRVNCASIPMGLIDAELFGHEKGSFTGAVESRLGWFERANGGTLLLDEIGEMNLEAQARLLRVLQDGEMFRVGGKKLIQVDVRVIAATHRDLKQMVENHEFREDLYYRICSFPIKIPSLRERTEDLPDLVYRFAERASKKFGLPKPPVTAQNIHTLYSYPWPGNVRELITVVERAVILGKGQILDVDSALGMPGSMTIKQNPIYYSNQKNLTTSVESFNSYDVCVRNHLIQALSLCHGRVDGPYGAAKLLQLNTNTLRSKLRRYKVDARLYRSPEL